MVEFFLAVFLMLLVSLIFGEILHRVKQPPLVGQLLAGVLIGPSILNIVQPTDDLNTITNIALFFVMLITGLSIRTKDIIEAGKRALVISLLAFTVPFVCGAEVATLFGLPLVESLVVGLTIAITAVPVNAIILMELGLLKTRLGSTVITAGVINDILSLIVLGMITSIQANGSISSSELTISIAKVLLFVGGVLIIDALFRHNPEWLRSSGSQVKKILQTRDSTLAVVLTVSIGVSLLAEQAGLHFIIGTFFAGLILNDAIAGESLIEATKVSSAITFGFFAPLLFAFIGIEFNAGAVAGVLLFASILLVVAVLTKLVSGISGALLTGFSLLESRTIGILMNSRGMVELVIATIAYQSGLIPLPIFSVVVAVGIITTIISGSAARISVPTIHNQSMTGG